MKTWKRASLPLHNSKDELYTQSMCSLIVCVASTGCIKQLHFPWEKCTKDKTVKSLLLRTTILATFPVSGYKKIDRIFLITEVFYVSEVKVYVGIADQEDMFIMKGKLRTASVSDENWALFHYGMKGLLWDVKWGLFFFFSDKNKFLQNAHCGLVHYHSLPDDMYI